MANLTTKRYLEKYRPNEETTVVDLNQHELTIIHEPHDEVETFLKKNIIVSPDKHYAAGPIIDRLAEFEAIGMEPEDIRSLYKAHKELLKKYVPKKVVVETKFRYDTNELKHHINGCAWYPSVTETRYYHCPSCNANLTHRYKITKLYPNRTIGTEGTNTFPIEYSGKDHCSDCGQPLDWTDVDKETWE